MTAASISLISEASSRAVEPQQPVSEQAEFLTTLAAELQGPLTLLLANLEMMQLTVSAPGAERNDKLLRSTTQQARELGRLVTGVAEMAKSEAGRLTVSQLPAPIHDLVRRAVDSYRRSSSTNRVQLGAMAPAVAQVGTDRFQAMVTGLLSAAQRSCPTGSTLTVEVATADECVHVSVATPIGSSSPGAVAHLSTALHLARKLARLQGGDVVATAADDGVMTFSLSLPMCEAKDAVG